MKRKAFTLVELIVVVLILAILAVVLWPVFPAGNHGGNPRRSSCQANLKQVGLAFLQYTQDYDEKFPPVANASAGYWAGSLQPYLKDWRIFQCPSDGCGSVSKTTDYYYNARVAAVAFEKFGWPKATILAGEGAGNQPPSYHLSQLPRAWRSDEKSPAHRHSGDANYLFVDGHAKWLEPEKITLDKPSSGNPTFLVKP